MPSYKTYANPLFVADLGVGSSSSGKEQDNSFLQGNFNDAILSQPNLIATNIATNIGQQNQNNNQVLSNLIGANLQNNAVLDQGFLNLNFNWTAEKIAEPIYTKGNDTFGVISHIDPFSSQFANAKRGIEDLRNEILDVEGSLTRKIGSYIEGLYEAENADSEELDRFFSDYYSNGQFSIPSLSSLVEPGQVIEGEVDENGVQRRQNDQTALFTSGKVMRDDIRITQQLRSVLVRFRKFQQKKVKNIQDKLATTNKEIVDAHKTLANLNRKRLESASDYQVVKQLVAEDWAKVESDYAERARILNNNQGFYFARVRETAVNASPPAPLALRFSSANDLVPGCPLEDRDLPEELEAFMESVLDIGMSDWAELRAHYRLLPARQRLDKLLARRKTRLDYRVNASQTTRNTFLSLRMARLHVQNKSLVREMSRQSFVNADSLAKYQWASARLISLEDLLSGPPHRLRAYAESLRNKLDQASHCILQELRQVRPSIRLDWAEAAEADTLAVDKPSQWPGLDRAEKDDFNGVRTMIELVQWWFRQLAPDASSSAYTAVRNLIRASLLIASTDDPEEILHGQLQTVPSRFKLGDAMRLSLNREALPGTLLQLLDNNSRLVGTLTVEDHDNDGAVATLTQLHDIAAVPATSFTVSGYSLPAYRRE